MLAPWNASWTGEDRYEVRPCRWVGGRLALWSPHAPGEGRPVFAKPHMVRQRRSIVEMRCTVCGEKTPPDDRWWFGLGQPLDGGPTWGTTEAPVHRACADTAMRACPHLRNLGAAPSFFPSGWAIVSAIVGGAATDADFGVKINGRRVVGHLKFAWPTERHALSASAALDRYAAVSAFVGAAQW